MLTRLKKRKLELEESRSNQPENPSIRAATTAATTIQTAYRRHRDQTRYGIKPLDVTTLTDYQAFVEGNDPDINQLAQFRPLNNQRIALIATSGLRAIQIACDLSPTGTTPKIIIVDNSSKVYYFWKKVQDVFNAYAGGSNLMALMMQLHPILSDASVVQLSYNGDRSPQNYLFNLIGKFGITTVRNAILNTTCIKQSWATPGLFSKIKNILQLKGITNIYAYPSNILACVNHPDLVTKLLENIAALNPAVAIHTDLCLLHEHPHHVHYITDHTPSEVKRKVLGNNGSNSTQAIYNSIFQQLLGFGYSASRPLTPMSSLISPGISAPAATTTTSAAAAAAAITSSTSNYSLFSMAGSNSTANSPTQTSNQSCNPQP